jgi:MFS family permease
MFGVLCCNFLVDRIYKSLQRRSADPEKQHPENRLPLVIAGAIALPLIVALYGWTAQLHWPVAVLLLSVGGQGFVCIGALVPMMAYIVDATGLYSASALTAVLITRCLAGTFIPLATAPLADKVGFGWGFTILAGICLVLAPIPILIMRYGAVWRQRSGYTKDQ